MWRARVPCHFGLTIFGYEVLPTSDVIDPTSPTAQKLVDEMKHVRSMETGWDRLKSIFQLDEWGAISPELDNTLTGAMVGVIAGFFIGGVPASKLAHNDFIDRNKASQFKSHLDAKEKLQFSVTKAMAAGGWRVAWRLGLFTGFYVFFTTAVSTYRNKSSVLEYTIGTSLAGAAYKLPMGPKAMVSGAVAGSVLGTVAGAVSLGVMKATGTTTEELRFWRKGWKEYEQREMTSIDKPIRAKNLGHLGLMHDLGLDNPKKVSLPEDPPAASDQAPPSSSTSPDVTPAQKS